MARRLRARARRVGAASSAVVFNRRPRGWRRPQPCRRCPTSGRQALRAGSDGRRLPTPTSLAPDAGYPAYSQRGLSPAPPALPGSGQINNAMPRNAAAYSAPSYEGTARDSSGYSAAGVGATTQRAGRRAERKPRKRRAERRVGGIQFFIKLLEDGQVSFGPFQTRPTHLRPTQ